MADLEHEQVFFEFVKQGVLQHLTYNETKREDQEIIGLMVGSELVEENMVSIPFVSNLLLEEDTTIIDPNYDEIYNSFLKIDYNLDSVKYIKNIVDNITTKEDLLDFIITVIIEPLINSNIDAKKVYFIVKPYWVTDWCDKIIEVE